MRTALALLALATALVAYFFACSPNTADNPVQPAVMGTPLAAGLPPGTPASVACEGSLDVVDTVAQPTGAVTVQPFMLRVAGWTTVSVKDARVPDQVYAVLTEAATGRQRWSALPRTERPDLRGPGYEPLRAGFESDIATLDLRGAWTLEIWRKVGTALQRCQLRVEVTFVKGL